MWIEAILSQDDLVQMVAQLTPLKMRLGNDGDLLIHDASKVTLLPGVGVRVVCKAKLHWPVLGINMPVTLHSLTLDLVPKIAERTGHNELVFKLRIEAADIAGIPGMIDDRIMEKVNKELAEDRAELTWNFIKTLSHDFALPRSLEPLDSIDLKVAWGEVKVTDETLVFAVSYHPHVTRHAVPA
jgi:hypothetical protein